MVGTKSAAQIPVELMGNIKNEKVLDLCAAQEEKLPNYLMKEQ